MKIGPDPAYDDGSNQGEPPAGQPDPELVKRMERVVAALRANLHAMLVGK